MKYMKTSIFLQNLLLELKNYEANQQQKGGRGVAPVTVAGEEEVKVEI